MGGGACRQGGCSFPPKKITLLPLQNVAVGKIVYKLLRLYLTIPVASATSEGKLCALKRLKPGADEQRTRYFGKYE